MKWKDIRTGDVAQLVERVLPCMKPGFDIWHCTGCLWQSVTEIKEGSPRIQGHF